MHTHRVFLCLPCMRGRRAVRRAFKHRANHWYNESDSTEDDERTASAFRIGHRAGTAVLPPCSTPQQLTEQQNKNTRRGTAGVFILVELTGVEPVSKSSPTFKLLQFSSLLDKTTNKSVNTHSLNLSIHFHAFPIDIRNTLSTWSWHTRCEL